MGNNDQNINLHELRQIVDLIVNQSSSDSESDTIDEREPLLRSSKTE